MSQALPRVLVIAEAANPAWSSVPLVGWSHASALRKVARVHLVTQVRNREAIERAGWPSGDVTFIDSERLAGPAYRLANLLRGGSATGWTTRVALYALTYPYFERLVWRRFGTELLSGAFDVVHRITPLSPTVPSPLAARCGKARVPFVLGPLNGGVPWPRAFDAARRKEREWLSYIRGCYRWLPGYRSTLRHSAAILCGSRDTLEQVPAWRRDRCVYIPENAIDPDRFPPGAGRPWSRPLRVVFVGRLVPYKGADMLLDAAEELVRAGRVTVEVIGDGPERAALEAQVSRAGIGSGVRFHGWLEHGAVRGAMAEAHVLGFPSIREFGGGVVLEAMALGVVPLVVSYGGPAELITPGTGIGVPMGDRRAIVSAFRRELERLCEGPDLHERLSVAASERVRRCFTWEAKASQVLEVYRWVMGEHTERPDFGMPLREPTEPAQTWPVALHGSAPGGVAR